MLCQTAAAGHAMLVTIAKPPTITGIGGAEKRASEILPGVRSTAIFHGLPVKAELSMLDHATRIQVLASRKRGHSGDSLRSSGASCGVALASALRRSTMRGYPAAEHFEYSCRIDTCRFYVAR